MDRAKQVYDEMHAAGMTGIALNLAQSQPPPPPPVSCPVSARGAAYNDGSGFKMKQVSDVYLQNHPFFTRMCRNFCSHALSDDSFLPPLQALMPENKTYMGGW